MAIDEQIGGTLGSRSLRVDHLSVAARMLTRKLNEKYA
jgi:hypothetical protein